MKTLKILKDIHLDNGNCAAPDVRQLATQIVGWIQRQKLFEVDVVSSDFTYRAKSYSHYLVKFAGRFGGRWAGHGRSEDPHLAFIKAFAEAIERATMQTYFNDSKVRYAGLLHRTFDSSGSLTPNQSKIRFEPGVRLHNSNGWAVHSEMGSAFHRAFKEALERHSMQLRYWSEGIEFLYPDKTFRERDYTVQLSSIWSGFGDYQILTASFSREGIPGKVFGHSAVRSGSVNDWTHPEIEGFQVAEPLKGQSSSTPPEDIIDQIQRSFWFEDKFIGPTPGAGQIQKVDYFNLNILAMDLGESFGFPFPLYACWVFSDSLMPLYLEAALTEADKRLFREQYKFIVGRERLLEQTPFI